MKQVDKFKDDRHFMLLCSSNVYSGDEILLKSHKRIPPPPSIVHKNSHPGNSSQLKPHHSETVILYEWRSEHFQVFLLKPIPVKFDNNCLLWHAGPILLATPISRLIDSWLLRMETSEKLCLCDFSWLYSWSCHLNICCCCTCAWNSWHL